MKLSARMSTIVTSSNSSSTEKTRYEYQDPEESVVVNERSGRLDDCSNTDCSNGIMIVLDPLKSGKVKLRRTNDQGNLIAVLGKM